MFSVIEISKRSQEMFINVVQELAFLFVINASFSCFTRAVALRAGVSRLRLCFVTPPVLPGLCRTKIWFNLPFDLIYYSLVSHLNSFCETASCDRSWTCGGLLTCCWPFFPSELNWNTTTSGYQKHLFSPLNTCYQHVYNFSSGIS